MKRLAVVLLVLAAGDAVFDHGAGVIACWHAIREFGATIHRGFWSSQ